MTTSTALGTDPAAVDGVGVHLLRLADGLGVVAGGLAAAPDGWQGRASAAFHAVLAIHPQRFDEAAHACRVAGAALRGHAANLVAARASPHGGVIAAESAVATARALDGAAAGAPARGPWAARAADRLNTWRAEVGLGAVEALEGLVGLALRLSPGRAITHPSAAAADRAALAADLFGALRDPLALARAVLDTSTWASNPARAVGHLLPDALAATAGGGAVTAAGRSASAARRVADASAARRSELAARAVGARDRLVLDAADDVRLIERMPWTGAGGARLAAQDSALADAYLRAHLRAEPRITAQIRELAGRLGVRLEQLPQRVKQAASLKRKLATQQAGAAAAEQLLRARHGDTLRYSMVLPDVDYVRGVVAAADGLDRRGFALHAVRNWWPQPDGYRGLNTVWADPRSGVRLELQFHTPRSWQATVGTHGLYEARRLPDTPVQRQLVLQDRISAAYRTAVAPPGAAGLGPSTLPPVPLPATHAVRTGLILAGSAHTGVGADRRLRQP